jgi:hypothetical protein
MLGVMLGCAAASCAPPPPSAQNDAGGRVAETTTLEGAVPDGWSIEQRHDADFNGDSRADALLLLRRPAPADTTPPRMLLVALGTTTPGEFTVDAINRALVPHDPSGGLEDPLADGGIALGEGGFELTLGMLSGAGSYEAATMRYGFRYQNGCFRLIRYRRAQTHRATLATRDLSVDFLTGEVVEATGNAQSADVEERRTRLQTNPRRCLPELPSGWTFDPLTP